MARNSRSLPYTSVAIRLIVVPHATTTLSFGCEVFTAWRALASPTAAPPSGAVWATTCCTPAVAVISADAPFEAARLEAAGFDSDRAAGAGSAAGPNGRDGC